MKKIFLILIILSSFVLAVNATETIQYKNLRNKTQIMYNQDFDSWSTKVNRKTDKYYVKTATDNGYEYLNSDDSFAFSTGCSYEFLKGNDLIGYSDKDLKFYDFALIDGQLTKQELTSDDVQALFPDFKIVKISDFSPNTNSIKLKKRDNSQLIILNDTDKNFEYYAFTSGNAKFKTYELAGFIKVTKKGMIQFSHFGENNETTPWFILLMR